MNRRITGVVGVAAALGLAATALPGSAHAVPGTKDLRTLKGTQTTVKPDNRPDAQQTKRAALRQKAVDDLIAGKAKTTGKGSQRTIRMADGTQVDYPVNQTAQLLTFLVDFGDGEGNPDFPENTAGPVHNEITKPGSTDNTTYWEPDFSREHYLDMFFNGLPDQNGESFHNVYKEMSSGRFDLQGDVSDWVKVPHPEAYYQDKQDADNDPDTPDTGEETGQTMEDFLTDAATAWEAKQKEGGASDQTLKDYLAKFDVWDRNDYDHDGDFNEPDGYIDHFQAIHAGTGEEAGAPTWTIWSHRSSVNPKPGTGPAENPNGGIEIGNTGFWIRDYTTEPENGGLGVFAHEFGHDLGLPDYYDTVNGDNGTGFWTLMSSGSWLGHGTGTTGTTPNHMGATEKLFLGWYGPGDLAIVDGTKAPMSVAMGPSYHSTNLGAQAVAVTLPKGSATVDVVEPDAGKYLYSGNGDERTATATSPDVSVPAAPDDATLKARVSFSIEDDWDYAYLKVSADGGATWDYVPTNLSTTTDPNKQNLGDGITGCSGDRDDDGVCDNAWTDLTADLSAYAGQTVKVQFAMVNDAAYHELGFSVDSVSIGDTLLTDVEDGASGWTLTGFRVMDGSSYTTVFDQYYLAENRQYRGYDKTLAEGPYSWDYPVSAPNRVDQFPYQDGLLVWYANGLTSDNNASSHPGIGQALPVDANPEFQLWTNGGEPYAYPDGRLNTYDSTFDVDQSQGLHLTSETPEDGPIHFDVDAHPSVPVFEDTDPNAYWDDSWSISGWFSTKVAGVGTEIQVLSSDEKTGRMMIKVGSKFVANTTGASVTGTPGVGQTLTATQPTWFQPGVTAAYQWFVDGQAVDGADEATYTVKRSDLGKKISVAVVGTKTGYVASRVVSDEVTVGNGTAPTATKAPAISGTPRVGQRLTVTPGTWPVDGTSTYAWSVGGKVVGSGTAYVLKPADAGKAVTVTETRTADGYQPGTSTSAPTAKVLPAPVALSVKAPKSVKKGKKATVTVTVSSAGLVPGGTVTVRLGGRSVTKALSGGHVTVKVPTARKGKKALVVVYHASTGFSGATSTRTIRVR